MKDIDLLDVLKKLSQKEIQVKLLVGYQDSINGYGWHTVYYCELITTNKYCEKCRKNYNVDYKEDYYPNQHNHAHRSESKIIYSSSMLRDENELINQLSKYLT